MFNGLFIGLFSTSILWKIFEARYRNNLSLPFIRHNRIQTFYISKNNNADKKNKDIKPAAVASFQARFLVVFWLMRMADWLQGPYFYKVYSSKIINGAEVSMDLVSKLFLVGFATTGIFGPWLGRMVDSMGRKTGTLAYAALYIIGTSTQYIDRYILIIIKTC